MFRQRNIYKWVVYKGSRNVLTRCFYLRTSVEFVELLLTLLRIGRMETVCCNITVNFPVNCSDSFE